jgi:hypothetical protein
VRCSTSRRDCDALPVGALLAATFAIFSLLPDIVIAPRIPDDAQAVYLAVLLAIKNPTIIAFTMIWQVGVIRQILLQSPDVPDAPPHHTRRTSEGIKPPGRRAVTDAD